jgi:DNA-binding response OmpR family regulator
MLVLIAGPDEDDLDRLASYLVVENFLLETARTSEQAIAKAVLVAPDVVLLDLDWPREVAWQTFLRLRSSLHTSSIPVVGIASHARPALRARAQVAGCSLLQRPFSQEELVAAIRGVRPPVRRRPRAGGRRLRIPHPPTRILR